MSETTFPESQNRQSLYEYKKFAERVFGRLHRRRPFERFATACTAQTLVLAELCWRSISRLSHLPLVLAASLEGMVGMPA